MKFKLSKNPIVQIMCLLFRLHGHYHDQKQATQRSQMSKNKFLFEENFFSLQLSFYILFQLFDKISFCHENEFKKRSRDVKKILI